MPRGKRTNTALRCSECENPNDAYVIRLIKDIIKGFTRNKYCSKCRKHTPHKAKEIKGGY
ncbi:MAG: 50S ribosomal protein L33 [Candidatus Gracilibacteria bacterium]|nr:50S ribosomal protein L33 [Candidatus Gracilibacteria bacterium]